MRVITAKSSQTGENGCYHIIDECEIKSVCGVVEADNLFAGNVGEIISQNEAEERGLQPCDRCLMYTGRK